MSRLTAAELSELHLKYQALGTLRALRGYLKKGYHIEITVAGHSIDYVIGPDATKRLWEAIDAELVATGRGHIEALAAVSNIEGLSIEPDEPF